jgi:hypothetical protein
MIRWQVVVAVIVGLIPATVLLVFAWNTGNPEPLPTPSPVRSTYHAPPPGPVPDPFVSGK